MNRKFDLLQTSNIYGFKDLCVYLRHQKLFKEKLVAKYNFRGEIFWEYSSILSGMFTKY